MLYVGAHSTKNIPELDVAYLGSGADLPERNYTTCSKTILATYNSRNELLEAEMKYILENSCIESKQYYNKRYKSTFDKLGQSIITHTNIEITAKKLRGRSKENFEYLKEKGFKHSFYRGENRTPLQKMADENMRGKVCGSNPLKGNPSINNPAFVPWYYIDSIGNYYEIYDKTKLEYSTILGVHSNFITARCAEKYAHRKVKKGKLKGYIFGNIDSKPSDIV